MIKTEDIRKIFVEKYKTLKQSNSITDTIEIIGAQFIADSSIIFGNVNENYLANEIAWYKSQSLNVNDIPNTPKIWTSVADPSGFINSNYGWCIFSPENNFQYYNCLAELKENPNTRRATMIYNRPSMWEDYNKNGMSDFMCTFSTQYFIRNNKLDTLVYMRSNDSIFGFKNDLGWQTHVSNKLIRDLSKTYPSIEMNPIIWHAGNLHIYSRHYKLIEEYIKENNL